MELLLLHELPGYTRATLAQEPAAVVNRWLMVLEAREAAQSAKGKSASAHLEAVKSRGG